MASIGHVAVGLLIGRVYDARSPREQAVVMATFGGLALLPDADVVGVAFGGLADHGLYGHRGYSHSLLFAATVTGIVYMVARKWGTRPAFTALLAFLAVASHGILDAMTYRTRGIPFFWPLTEERFVFPWRFIPAAPTGSEYVSHRGLEVAGVELVYFLPLALMSLTPSIATWRRWLGKLAFWRTAVPTAIPTAVSAEVSSPVVAPLSAQSSFFGRGLFRVAAISIAFTVMMAVANVYLSQSSTVAWIERSTQQNLAVSLMRRPQFRHLR